MKKILSVLIAFVLMLFPTLILSENEAPAPEVSLTGDWFGEIQGMVLQLTLNEDGTYQAVLPAQENAKATGAWALRDGFLYLDGNDLPSVNVLGEDVLKWIDFDIFLRREAPLLYTPAEPLADVPQEIYAGYWKALYAGVDGAMLMANTLGEPSGAYIEGTSVALTGPLTGEALLEAAYADGALRWTDGNTTITLQLQQDGFLRLTFTAGENTVTLYLMGMAMEAPVEEAGE